MKDCVRKGGEEVEVVGLGIKWEVQVAVKV